MSEWREVAVADLGTVVTGGTPPAKHPEWFGSSMPFITPSDMTATDRRARPDRGLSVAGVKAFTRRVIPAGSVCFVCIGSIGKICLTEAEAVTNQQVNSIVPNRRTNGTFLYYLLKHEARNITNLAGGAATPILNKSNFERVALRVPSLPTQVRIASTLGGMDDLIENNRQRVEVLEAMARTIFREWFVRFRYPGYEDAALVGSSIGLIPDGWQVGTVGSLGTVTTGSTPPSTKMSYWGREGDVPFLTPSEMSVGRLWAHPVRFLSAEGAALMRTRLIPPGAVCFACIGSIGKIAIATATTVTNQQVNSIVVAPDKSTSAYVFHYLAEAAESIRLTASGAATPIINKSAFSAILVLVPPVRIAKRFQDLVDPLHNQILLAEHQIVSLGRMRDSLLSRVMTGEVDLSALDLDGAIEGALA